jgi:putative pyruvate formate lyase activating enzyme
MNLFDTDFIPAYVKLHKSGELKKRGRQLWDSMNNCKLCPRNCEKNRIEGETGVCKAGFALKISSVHPHFGEEDPLVGKNGSGTIFFTHCCLRCVFCLNFDISIEGAGHNISIGSLAENMLTLQNMGCYNINLVTPTHFSPHIILAIDKAAEKGLKIPIVYNTCGYEKLETLKILDGIIDIYLPDFKYINSEFSGTYSSKASDYPSRVKEALLEMHRQVGVAKPNKNGIMQRGLMIRHLVMPNNVSGTQQVIQWIADNLPHDTYINLMSQYRPYYKAMQFADISRGLTNTEYDNAIIEAKQAGLTNLEIQGF